MVLCRASGLCRLALRAPWAAVRLLSSVGVDGEPLSGEDKGRRFSLEALRRERALQPPTARPPPPPPRRKVFTEPYATPEQLQLNKDIQACATGEAVLALVVARQAVMNEVNAATALITLSRRVSKHEAAAWLSGDARFEQLLHAAKSGFEKMGTRALSNVLYALGQLGIAPPAAWLRRYWSVCAAKFLAFNPQDLSNAIYACGQLGIMPHADWLERFWNSSLLGFTEQGLSNTLYALALLRLAPQARWQQQYWAASAAILDQFTVQALANVLYACALLGIMPPSAWLPGFWDECVSKLAGGDANPQHISNILFACGQLCLTPPAAFLEQCWRVSVENMDAFHDFKSQELTNSLYALSKLNIRPPAEWLHAYSRAYAQLLPEANQQDIGNTALALATLALWELPLWPSLWARVWQLMPHDFARWNADERLLARQVYQVYQAAKLERPGLPEPAPELLAAVRSCWLHQLQEPASSNSSRLHEEVSAALTRMGVAHTNERMCERAERVIDIAVEGGAAPVALEVDGPFHFLQDGRQDGSTLLRNRMLHAHGWRVVTVDYRVWQHQLKTQPQRDEYLRSLLTDALPQGK